MASAKVDNQGPVGSKRSRNNTTQNDGDWTCPQCGNVNFSFRTVCNHGHCAAPRPSASHAMGSTPGCGIFYHPPPFYYGGVGAPPPGPLGLSNGFGAPYPLSGLHYDYASPSNAPGPYGLLSTYGPPAPIGGIGFGPGPGMDQYGYGFQGPPLPVPVLWTDGDLPDKNTS